MRARSKPKCVRNHLCTPRLRELMGGDVIMAAFAREYPRLAERGTPAPVTRFREEAGEAPR